jgi:hypothetical protein
VDLLAQHVGDPAGAVGPRTANRDWLRHAVTLTRSGGPSGAVKRGPRGRLAALRRVGFGGDQAKTAPAALLRHLGKGDVFAIPVN